MALLDVSFLQIGLAIVSAFFVLAGYVIIYENPFQSRTEIRAVAEQIESLLYEVDGYWFEQTKTSMFPECTLPVSAEISQEFVRVSALDSSSKQLVFAVPQTLWIVTENSSWITSESFHRVLFENTGHFGTRSDPCTNKKQVIEWFFNQYNQSQSRFHETPFIWTKGETLTFEKVIIFQISMVNGKIKSVPLIEFVILSD
jgi:hypothetical protein